MLEPPLIPAPRATTQQDQLFLGRHKNTQPLANIVCCMAVPPRVADQRLCAEYSAYHQAMQVSDSEVDYSMAELKATDKSLGKSSLLHRYGRLVAESLLWYWRGSGS